jgi:hypothetical protein
MLAQTSPSRAPATAAAVAAPIETPATATGSHVRTLLIDSEVADYGQLMGKSPRQHDDGIMTWGYEQSAVKG